MNDVLEIKNVDQIYSLFDFFLLFNADCRHEQNICVLQYVTLEDFTFCQEITPKNIIGLVKKFSCFFFAVFLH